MQATSPSAGSIQQQPQTGGAAPSAGGFIPTQQPPAYYNHPPHHPHHTGMVPQVHHAPANAALIHAKYVFLSMLLKLYLFKSVSWCLLSFKNEELF